MRNWHLILNAVLILFTLLASLEIRADAVSEEKVIQISAKKFEFTPSVIKVKKGVPVTIELASTDRKHGFKIKEFKIEATVKPGKKTRITFTPDKVGSFLFHCNVFCGSGHEDMVGTIEVTE